MNGDLSAIKSALSNAFARAVQAKDKAESKTATEARAAPEAARSAASTDAADPAFLMTADLQDLTGALRPYADKAGKPAREGVSQAYDALGRMEGIAAFSEAFGKQLDAIMDGIGRDLDRTLKAFGFDDESRDKASKDLTSVRERDEPAAAQAAYTSDWESAAMSVEVKNIQLTFTDGDRKLSLSFDQASLSVSHAQGHTDAAVGADGSEINANSSETALKAQSMGLSIDATGFSKEELSSIMDRIGEAMNDGTFDEKLEGLAKLAPQAAASSGAPLKATLSLTGFLDAVTGGSAASDSGIKMTV